MFSAAHSRLSNRANLSIQNTAFEIKQDGKWGGGE